MSRNPDISPRHQVFGVELQTGDGSTVVIPRRMSPMGCAFGFAAVALALLGFWSWTLLSEAAERESPVALAALVLVVGVCLVMFMGLLGYIAHHYNAHRKPLLVIDHAAREVRLPRERVVVPFAHVLRLELLSEYFDRMSEEGIWYQRVSVVGRGATGEERCFPAYAAPADSQTAANPIAEHLAAELGVPLTRAPDDAAAVR